MESQEFIGPDTHSKHYSILNVTVVCSWEHNAPMHYIYSCNNLQMPLMLTLSYFSDSDYDYDPEDLEHTFLPGTLVGTEGCVNIPIFEDLTDEDDESFLAILSSSTAEIDEDITQVIIIDNDEPRKQN